MRIRLLIIFFAVWGLITVRNGWCLNTSVEAGLGYDDNAAEVSDGEGSGFSQYRLRLDQPFPGEANSIRGNLFLEGGYTRYFDLDDSYQLLAGGELILPTWKDRLRPALFGSAFAYRDDLVEEDEQNNYLIGARMEWMADARLNLTLRGSLALADYLNEVNLPGRRFHSPGKGMGPPGGRTDPSFRPVETFSREDTIGTIEFGAVLYPVPDIQADFRVHHRRVDSSAEFESLRENGVSAWMSWFPSEAWELFASGSRAWLDYDRSPDETGRADDFYTVGLGIRRFLGDFEMYVQIDRTENDSPVDGEDYAKTVTRCGLVYSF